MHLQNTRYFKESPHGSSLEYFTYTTNAMKSKVTTTTGITIAKIMIYTESEEAEEVVAGVVELLSREGRMLLLLMEVGSVVAASSKDH